MNYTTLLSATHYRLVVLSFFALFCYGPAATASAANSNAPNVNSAVPEIIAGGSAIRTCEYVDGSGFSCSTMSGVPSITVHDMAVGDLNGDDFGDIFFAGRSTQSRSCINDGSDTFTCSVASSFGNIGVDLGDMDNDGDLDVVSVNGGSIGDQLCLNDGSGGFGDANCSQTGTDRGQDVAVADLNSDGNLDAIFARRFSSSDVCLGDGAGGLSCSPIAGVPNNAFTVQVGDLDADGDIDAVFGGNSYTCLNDGLGNLSCVTSVISNGRGIAIGDVNEDGHQDIAFGVAQSPFRVEVCLGDSSGTFLAANCSVAVSNSITNLRVALGDLDGDNHLDLGIYGGNSNSQGCLGDGTGAFTCSTLSHVGGEGGPEGLIIANLVGTPDPTTPDLTIPSDDIKVESDFSFTVPVNLATNGNNVPSVGFSVDYDQTCITFNEADVLPSGSPDGVFDALQNTPAGFTVDAAHDTADTDGELDIAIYYPNTPLVSLSDGVLVDLEFEANPTCLPNDGDLFSAAFNFSTDPAPEFADENGDETTGTSTGATIDVRINAAPTDIQLSATAIDENSGAGAAVGTLTTSDVDPEDVHTYSIGGTDAADFSINGDTLETAADFNFETKSSYTIDITTDDNDGGTYVEQFTITVNDLNDTPTDIGLDSTSVNEHEAAGTVVGVLSSVDEDAGATHTYSIEAGDTGAFNINGANLETAVEFNFEVDNSYDITIRTTDNGGETYDEQFTITIVDINDAPVAVDDPDDPVNAPIIAVGGSGTVIDVLANDTDEDPADTLTVSAAANGTNGTVTNNIADVTYTPNSASFNGTDSFTYDVTDDNGLGTLTDSATVDVAIVANDPRGDCNTSGGVGIADVVGVIIELFDSDSNTTWWEIYQSGYPGSPIGCDANASQSIGAADIGCTILVFFGNTTCTNGGAVQAASVNSASIAIDGPLAANAGDVVDVPLDLTSQNADAVALSFEVNFDSDQFSFDSTDADEDGVPDAVSFDVDSQMTVYANYNAEESRIEIAVYSLSLPFPVIADGPIATVQLQANADATEGASSIGLTNGSAGDAEGRDVTVELRSSEIAVGGVGTLPDMSDFIFLPFVNK